jgi:tetratricopeptide (TPR) repeat protein
VYRLAFFSISIFFAVPRALAQDDADGAREVFAQAERAFDENDYELALELFQRAQTLRPHDAVRFNVAVCLERLGRFREALAEYDLAAQSEQLPEETRAEARRMAERTRARLGTLHVSGPPGARVRVGALSCEVPCSLELDPGVHSAVVEGETATTHRAEISRGETLDLDGSAPERALPETGWSAFGVLTTIGAITLVTGIAGTIGFGLYTEDLGDQYVAMPSHALRDEGLLIRDLANTSIGLSIAGAILIAIDLILLAAP